MDNEPPREAGTFKLRWRPEKGDLMPGVDLEVFTRPDETFGFEEWKWLEEENSWCPLGQHPISITDTLERALEEARGRIPWVEQALPLP